jgi:hypothetical protein
MDSMAQKIAQMLPPNPFGGYVFAAAPSEVTMSRRAIKLLSVFGDAAMKPFRIAGGVPASAVHPCQSSFI